MTSDKNEVCDVGRDNSNVNTIFLSVSRQSDVERRIGSSEDHRLFIGWGTFSIFLTFAYDEIRRKDTSNTDNKLFGSGYHYYSDFRA